MAIVFKKKLAGTTPPTPPALSVRQEEDLAAVGLGPVTTPPPKQLISCSPALRPELFPTRQKSGSMFSEGQRARITNDLYPWVKAWDVGDMVTVIRYWPPVKEHQGDSAYGVVLVKLDTIREPGKDTAHFHAWELERVEPQQ